jgi:hypothetical protein
MCDIDAFEGCLYVQIHAYGGFQGKLAGVLMKHGILE